MVEEEEEGMGDVGWETVQALLPLLKPSHQSHTLEEVLGSLESVLGPQVLSSVERRQKIVQVISGVADPNLLDEVASNPQGTSSVGALSTERLRQKRYDMQCTVHSMHSSESESLLL